MALYDPKPKSRVTAKAAAKPPFVAPEALAKILAL
jgi:hypothetical protein